MSDYEKINAKIQTNMDTKRKEIVMATNILLAKVLVAIAIFWGLKVITFISATFMFLLISITICVGSFSAGRIWSGFHR